MLAFVAVVGCTFLFFLVEFLVFFFLRFISRYLVVGMKRILDCLSVSYDSTELLELVIGWEASEALEFSDLEDCCLCASGMTANAADCQISPTFTKSVSSGERI